MKFSRSWTMLSGMSDEWNDWKAYHDQKKVTKYGNGMKQKIGSDFRNKDGKKKELKESRKKYKRKRRLKRKCDTKQRNIGRHGR